MLGQGQEGREMMVCGDDGDGGDYEDSGVRFVGNREEEVIKSDGVDGINNMTSNNNSRVINPNTNSYTPTLIPSN